jgi:23S rRNA (uridine2552-2'-O)-methyltransferase
LRAGQRVVDLGCWPGGWLEEAARCVGKRGRVVGVDLAEIEPLIGFANAVALVGDVEDSQLGGRIRAVLGGGAQVVLSDAAPKLTGVREVDRANEERLLLAIEARIPELLEPAGDLLLKILEGPEAATIDRRLRAHFESAKTLKVKATRKGSTERYLLARGYRGPSESGADLR